MAKKAQAALEFLMTYGWAILVVLVVIGTLAYFGVLNPSILLPEKCTLQTGMYCKDHLINQTGTTIKVILQNGMGKDIKLPSDVANTIVGTGLGTCTYTPAADVQINNGASQEVIFAGCTIAAGDVGKKLKGTITLKWYEVGSTVGYTHTMNGELLGTVELGK